MSNVYECGQTQSDYEYMCVLVLIFTRQSLTTTLIYFSLIYPVILITNISMVRMVLNRQIWQQWDPYLAASEAIFGTNNVRFDPEYSR